MCAPCARAIGSSSTARSPTPSAPRRSGSSPRSQASKGNQVTTFIIVAALMVAAALAWVLWPLLRPGNRTSVERRMVNLSVYKDQFADLDADFARGSI
ncbi:MAG: c-type cytochrome biogenesis protein CcmI, partial [Burkholderiaceae bacterium]